jgi:hypothetical protein
MRPIATRPDANLRSLPILTLAVFQVWEGTTDDQLRYQGNDRSSDEPSYEYQRHYRPFFRKRVAGRPYYSGAALVYAGWTARILNCSDAIVRALLSVESSHTG